MKQVAKVHREDHKGGNTWGMGSYDFRKAS